MLITYLENGGPPRYGATALLQVMLDQTYVIGTQGYVNATSLTDAAVDHARNRRVIERAGVCLDQYSIKRNPVLECLHIRINQVVSWVSVRYLFHVHEIRGPASRRRAWACSPDVQTYFTGSVRGCRRRRSRFLPVSFR